MSAIRQTTEENPLHIGMGLMVLFASVVTFGLLQMEVLQNNVAPYASWMFAIGFIGVYLLSDRDIGEMSNLELGAFLIPVLIAMGMSVIPQVDSVITNYHPMSSFVLLVLTIAGFYVLSTDMSLGIVALQLILGGILITSLGVRYGFIEMAFLDENIQNVNVWVVLITFALSYMISDHSLGKMNRMEVGSLVVGLGAYVAYAYVQPFAEFVNANNPHLGVGLTVLVLLSYYFLMNNGQIRG